MWRRPGPPGRRNLVVVVASGGGILAAGWTTLALERLVALRPELRDEIRLLSGISGGSVGIAFYLDAVLRSETLADARVKSTSSSLAATAYGFAFRDFFRLLTGGLVPLDLDRGLLLERQWLKTANGKVHGDEVEMPQGVLTDRTMTSLRSAVAQGLIPAPILSATIMESGRRVMMTPIDFERPRRGRRAMTMSEFLFEERRRRAGEALVAVEQWPELDLPLWTAARLSATFAFVTPAARANLFDDPSAGTRPTDHRGHHIIDGGYYDNFGVTSALDWLDPVLAARLGGRDLDFERVLIIQLRAFRRPNPRDVPPKSGAVAALLGPLIGLEAIRDGAAVSRNDIELTRFATSWTARLRTARPRPPGRRVRGHPAAQAGSRGAAVVAPDRQGQEAAGRQLGGGGRPEGDRLPRHRRPLPGRHPVSRIFTAIDRISSQWLATWVLSALVATFVLSTVLSAALSPLVERTRTTLFDLQLSGLHPWLADRLADGAAAHEILLRWKAAGVLDDAQRGQAIDFAFPVAYGLFCLGLAAALWRVHPETSAGRSLGMGHRPRQPRGAPRRG